MSKKVTWRWNLKAFTQIRRLPAIQDRLRREATSIAAEAGDGYGTAFGEGRTRSRAVVYTNSIEGVRREYREQRLARIVASRRGRKS